MRYVAFLRAINVGGHVVKMERLRALFEELGLTNVETLIASGNVLFDSSARNAATLERTIEAKLRDALGYEVATFLRTAPRLAEIDVYEAFPANELAREGAVLYLGFVAAPPDEAATRKLLARATPANAFHVAGSEVYWLIQGRFSEAALTGAHIERLLGQPVTFRNINTVRKLAAMGSKKKK